MVSRGAVQWPGLCFQQIRCSVQELLCAVHLSFKTRLCSTDAVPHDNAEDFQICAQTALISGAATTWVQVQGASGM